MYEERGRGGGGADERQAPQKSEGNQAFNQQARYPGDDWRRAEGLTTSAGGAVSWAPHESRGNSGVRGRRDTRATPGNETRDSRQCGGRRLLSPSTNTQAKYCQPHRSRGEHAHNHRVTGADNRSSMAPAASQFSGGRRVTTGATGEATNNRKNGRRGGKRRRERDARAGKVFVDTEHGRASPSLLLLPPLRPFFGYWSPPQ